MKINLNEPVKFKLTDYGKDIYYHQYDGLNELFKKRGYKPFEPRMPKVDENGYTEMQLWQFIELYGNYIGMAMPNVIEPLEIIYAHPTEKVCTGKRCPMQVGYDVKNCKDKDCIYRTETEKGGVQE